MKSTNGLSRPPVEQKLDDLGDSAASITTQERLTCPIKTAGGVINCRWDADNTTLLPKIGKVVAYSPRNHI